MKIYFAGVPGGNQKDRELLNINIGVYFRLV